ncbi:hypothetical protein F3J27_11365 [Enterobacter sp. Ap-916]|nr:hypothetical protein [Enterobacter sp. Ap-867]NIG30084.1 hypothetical protein [Enterobacter sp. Ap-916]
MLTKREKSWFFPLCGYQPKINEFIFLFFNKPSGISSITIGLSAVLGRGAYHAFFHGRRITSLCPGWLLRRLSLRFRQRCPGSNVSAV